MKIQIKFVIFNGEDDIYHGFKYKLSSPHFPIFTNSYLFKYMTDRKVFLSCAVTAAITLIIFKTIFALIYVPTVSMEPAIGANSVCIGIRYPLAGEVHRGDIIIFRQETENKILCKRVIGLPGETISFKNEQVYINNELLNEPYLPDRIYTGSDKEYVTIPDGCYFVMGDNRSNSKDSRMYDNPYIIEDRLIAKIVIII